MTEPAREREFVDAVEAALHEQAGIERYESSQRQVRRRTPEVVDRPHPLEFDENGFPIAQSSPSFVTRVARLLSL
jgi:hypothetical protein